MVDENIKKLEAVLFAVARQMSIDEIMSICGFSKKEVKSIAEALTKRLEEIESPLMVVEELDGYKLTVREKFLPIVREIVPHTELSKSILETLAVIAWKHPVKQSDVISIRTNKAYDHIAQLEDLGFIRKEKYGRSFMIELTQKFFDYFDLPSRNEIKSLFNDFQIKEDKIKENELKLGNLKVYDRRDEKDKNDKDEAEKEARMIGETPAHDETEPAKKQEDIKDSGDGSEEELERKGEEVESIGAEEITTDDQYKKSNNEQAEDESGYEIKKMDDGFVQVLEKENTKEKKDNNYQYDQDDEDPEKRHSDYSEDENPENAEQEGNTKDKDEQISVKERKIDPELEAFISDEGNEKKLRGSYDNSESDDNKSDEDEFMTNKQKKIDKEKDDFKEFEITDKKE